MEKKETDVSFMPDEGVLFGRNAVMEALKNGRFVNKIFAAKGERQGSIREIFALAKEKGVLWQEADKKKLDDLASGMRHQGVVALVAPVEYASVEAIFERAEKLGEAPFVVLLDDLEDPRNVGAILRTADAVGVHGVLLPKRRSCPLSAAVAKTASGAAEYVPVARIGNIVQTLEKLKKQYGVWVAGADMDGTTPYNEADFRGPLVLVVGGEGRGVGRLVRKACDFCVHIPMRGHVNSLNASVAASILLYEAYRQRAAD